jgi:hypothetical protein
VCGLAVLAKGRRRLYDSYLIMSMCAFVFHVRIQSRHIMGEHIDVFGARPMYL